MTVRVQEGKYYRTAGGQVFGPLEKRITRHNEVLLPVYTAVSGQFWYTDGSSPPWVEAGRLVAEVVVTDAPAPMRYTGWVRMFHKGWSLQVGSRVWPTAEEARCGGDTELPLIAVVEVDFAVGDGLFTQ